MVIWIAVEIRIAELKARLSAVLRRVRAGEVVVVLDRDRPVARLVAHDVGNRLIVREPVAGAPLPGKVPLPRARRLRRDVVSYLLEERQSHR